MASVTKPSQAYIDAAMRAALRDQAVNSGAAKVSAIMSEPPNQVRNGVWLEKNLGASGLTSRDRAASYYVPGIKQADDTAALRTLEKRMGAFPGSLKGDPVKVGASGIRARDIAPENVDRLVAGAALTNAASEARTYAKMFKGINEAFSDPTNATRTPDDIAKGFMNPSASAIARDASLGVTRDDLDEFAYRAGKAAAVKRFTTNRDINRDNMSLVARETSDFSRAVTPSVPQSKNAPAAIPAGQVPAARALLYNHYVTAKNGGSGAAAEGVYRRIQNAGGDNVDPTHPMVQLAAQEADDEVNRLRKERQAALDSWGSQHGATPANGIPASKFTKPPRGAYSGNGALKRAAVAVGNLVAPGRPKSTLLFNF